MFVDLKKAFNSVPRTALWMALKKLGVPDQLVDIVKSFHEGMKARMRTKGDLLGTLDVENGLRQGCTLALTLFNIYTCLVAERWYVRVPEIDVIGVRVKYKFDRNYLEGTLRMGHIIR